MVGQDYKYLVRQPNLADWLYNAIVVITCVSVLFWLLVFIPESPTTPISKEDVKRLTTQALAEQTVLINQEMERRAKGVR